MPTAHRDHPAPPEGESDGAQAIARLFPEVGADWPDLPRAQVIGRLLEDGDSADLRHLARIAGPEALRAWLQERGGRQLSRRSRVFWELILGGDAPARPEVVDDLWLL